MKRSNLSRRVKAFNKDYRTFAKLDFDGCKLRIWLKNYKGKKVDLIDIPLYESLAPDPLEVVEAVLTAYHLPSYYVNGKAVKLDPTH